MQKERRGPGVSDAVSETGHPTENVKRKAPPKSGGGNKSYLRRLPARGLSYLRAHPIKVVTAVLGIVTPSIAAVTGFETARKIFETYRERHHYVQDVLKPPFDREISDADIAQMSSGQAQVDLMRIDGYLGLLKDGPNWKKMCVTKSLPHDTKDDLSRYLNIRFELEPSLIDEQNRLKLNNRVAFHEIEKDEDSEIQRSSDYYTRLLRRSSKQLLSQYSQDVDRLTRPQLYLLRNSIYGRHGYRFQTPKLVKLVNRRGWDRSPDKAAETASQVEQCNAFYLAERNPASELGSVGRGVLVKNGKGVADPLKSQICSCLSAPDSGIECAEPMGDDQAAQFRDYVDFIIELEQGTHAETSWTFLDPQRVDRFYRDDFNAHADRFTAAAVQFSAGIQPLLSTRSTKMKMAFSSHPGDFWGVKITLPTKLLKDVPRDAATTRDLAGSICKATREILENEGPIVPPTIETSEKTYATAFGALSVHPRTVLLGDRRRQVLRWYVSKAYPTSAANIDLDAQAIVLHGTGSTPVEQTLSTLSLAFDDPAKDPSDNSDIGFSAHYVVSKAGTVYSLVDDHFVVRHEAGLDLSSISIVLEDTQSQQLHPEQIDATVKLITFLKSKYKGIKLVVNADDASMLRGEKFWSAPIAALSTSLPGIGPAVYAAVRAKIDLAKNLAKIGSLH